MKKRILSTFLSVVTVLTLLPTVALAGGSVAMFQLRHDYENADDTVCQAAGQAVHLPGTHVISVWQNASVEIEGDDGNYEINEPFKNFVEKCPDWSIAWSVRIGSVEQATTTGQITSITVDCPPLAEGETSYTVYISASLTGTYATNGKKYEVWGYQSLTIKDPIPETDTSDIITADQWTNPFTDVSESDYYCDAVRWAAAKGVTGGTSATTFAPNTTCTRAQTVTFLWRAAGSPEPTATANPLTDVPEDAYYYKAVLWAVGEGITAGTSATTFAPDATVSRAQVAAFLWRAAGEPVVNYAMAFTDVPADSYYTEAVRWAVSEGITSGTSETTFAPADACTRAQIVTLLYRYLDK